jgi:hypothetical protein
MRYWKHLAVVAMTALLGLALCPSSRADLANEKTYLNFSSRIELPGVVLGPGTYMFKLLDNSSSRNIVEVTNKQGNRVYGIFLTIPDYIDQAHSRTHLNFAERPAKAPEALRVWFYPGNTAGHEFVYPHKRAVELARENHRSVASMPDNYASNINVTARTANNSAAQALRNAPVTRVGPNGQEQPVTNNTTAQNTH